jgi:hypothetical protein
MALDEDVMRTKESDMGFVSAIPAPRGVRPASGVGRKAIALAASVLCFSAVAACSKPAATVHDDAFLERLDPQQADCVRSTMKGAILDGVLAAAVESRTAVNAARRLTALTGCARADDLARAMAHVVVEALPRKKAPYGIESDGLPKRGEEVRKRLAGFAFDLAGRSRYRGVKRSMPGRYRVAYLSEGGGGIVQELRVEDVAASGIRPEGWSADDVVGALVLGAGPASVEGGRDDDVVWALLPAEPGTSENRKKVVWAAIGGSMLYVLEGSEDEFMSAIVSELAASKGS